MFGIYLKADKISNSFCMTVCVIWILFIGRSLACCTSTFEEPNIAIEKALELARNIVKNNPELTPVKMPPIQRTLYQNIFMAKVPVGTIKITNGKIFGLENIYRAGNSECNQNSNGKVSYSSHLEMRNLRIEASVFKNALGLVDLYADIEAKIWRVRFYFNVEFCFKTECKLELSDFKIEDIGEILLKVKNFPWFDGLISEIINNLRKDIAKEFEKPIKDFIQNEIDNIDVGKILENLFQS